MTLQEEIKEQVRERDGYSCADCGVTQSQYQFRQSLTTHNGKSRKLDVHRLVPGTAYSLENCVTLCRSCHKRRHCEGRPAQAPKENRPSRDTKTSSLDETREAIATHIKILRSLIKGRRKNPKSYDFHMWESLDRHQRNIKTLSEKNEVNVKPTARKKVLA